ncbi:hypothetical protein Ssi03_62730 [Sphaerisporangium siamense]|uniref:Uncharacterized protein n=1 Tax=Sphaerisporangium siamense TaxID=795645 RepID=A0A7W7GD29_9ACTN|nr:hypothetical protein [Sphaerisporangium siamense]MBB4702581.1 hypothetical protein [Sphaerisporangium siamense]GII88283.1 hypothetical protein Ssi03_62730 [Sphaerisporangium siamense]
MTFLSKDDLWEVSSEIPYDDVRLVDPDGKYRGTMRVRGMTADEAQVWQNAQMVTVGNKQRVDRRDAASKLVLLTVVKEDFSPFFEKSDLLKIRKMPAWILNALTEAAIKQSGMSEDAKVEIEEDFDPAQSED